MQEQEQNISHSCPLTQSRHYTLSHLLNADSDFSSAITFDTGMKEQEKRWKRRKKRALESCSFSGTLATDGLFEYHATVEGGARRTKSFWSWHGMVQDYLGYERICVYKKRPGLITRI